MGVYHGFYTVISKSNDFQIVYCNRVDVLFLKDTPLMKIYITLNLFNQIMVKTRWQVIYENKKDFCTENYHKKLTFYGFVICMKKK